MDWTYQDVEFAARELGRVDRRWRMSRTGLAPALDTPEPAPMRPATGVQAAVRPPSVLAAPPVAGAIVRPRLTLAAMLASNRKAQGDSVLVAGKPKTGKTSGFAFGAPKPFFIFADKRGDAVLPESFGDKIKPDAWDDPPGANTAGLTVLGALRFLRDEEHGYQTVVIDTINDTESMLWEYVVANDKSGAKSITEVGEGWGNGYVKAREQFQIMRAILDDLAVKKGIHWILISHVDTKTDNDPTDESYEKWALDLNRKAGAVLLGAVNTILFAVPEVAAKNVAKAGARQAKMRGGRTGVTKAIVQSKQGIDAGSRWLLPPEMVLSWAVYEEEKAKGSKLREQLAARLSTLDIADRAEADRYLSKHGHSRDAVEQILAGFMSEPADTETATNIEEKS